MTGHLDDLALSEVSDGRQAVPAAHLQACGTCRDRLEALRALRAEAALERVRTYDTPDTWPVIAARTVHRKEVRRAVLRSLRLPLILWTLVAFGLGVVATEAVRELSRQTAESSWSLRRQVDRSAQKSQEALDALRKAAPRR